MELVDKNCPVLKKVALPATIKQGRETGRELLKVLARLNRHRHRAIGLAAPQIGISLRVCALTFSAYELPIILINPRIDSHSEVTIDRQENCLSLPNETYVVKRFPWCKILDDNIYDKPQHFGPTVFEEWTENSLLRSSCVQHELNHLDGILISDIGEKNVV